MSSSVVAQDRVRRKLNVILQPKVAQPATSSSPRCIKNILPACPPFGLLFSKHGAPHTLEHCYKVVSCRLSTQPPLTLGLRTGITAPLFPTRAFSPNFAPKLSRPKQQPRANFDNPICTPCTRSLFRTQHPVAQTSIWGAPRRGRASGLMAGRKYAVVFGTDVTRTYVAANLTAPKQGAYRHISIVRRQTPLRLGPKVIQPSVTLHV